MGHTNTPDREYRLLQQRLAQKVQGAAESPLLLKILAMLFSPAEADLARRLPHNFTSLETLAKKLSIPQDELDDQMTEMARRGVVMDVEHKGRRYLTLPPIVIGLFEFTFMRSRPDMDMAGLAGLFEEYLGKDDRFARSVFEGETQMFRTLVREEALPANNHTEILDWERAGRIIESATSTAAGLCQCHHTALHLNQACAKPREVCLTLNYAAETLVRGGHAREIGKGEALQILARSKEAGLAQTGDNVRNKVSFICNCCGCCCHLMRGIRKFELNQAIVTSNWLMTVDPARCKGCGICAKACPVDAIQLAEEERAGEKNKKWAVPDKNICLGCGVCATVCKTGAATMQARDQRVFTPETVFDQRILMAMERGKLADLLFDDPEKLSHRALGRIVSMIEKSSPFKAALAVKPLKSTFLNTMVKGARRKAGDLAELVT